MGFDIVREVYREERNSYKLDLSVNGKYQIELFSFPNPGERGSRPESKGLRHLAFAVDNLEEAVNELEAKGVTVENIRIDEYTNKRFTFFADPNGQPLELYEEVSCEG